MWPDVVPNHTQSAFNLTNALISSHILHSLQSTSTASGHVAIAPDLINRAIASTSWFARQITAAAFQFLQPLITPHFLALHSADALTALFRDSLRDTAPVRDPVRTGSTSNSRVRFIVVPLPVATIWQALVRFRRTDPASFALLDIAAARISFSAVRQECIPVLHANQVQGIPRSISSLHTRSYRSLRASICCYCRLFFHITFVVFQRATVSG
jgi:hypothetical protein